MRLKYIWRNHLSTRNSGCACVGEIVSNDNNKNMNIITTTLNVCIPSSPTTVFVKFYDLVYVILTAGVVQKSCINPNVLNI